MVQAWLRHDLTGYLGFDGSQIKTCTSGGEIKVDAAEKDNVSGKSAKLARCVRVCINFTADTLKSSKEFNHCIK